MTMTIEPGIHANIPDSNYRELPQVSKSDLDQWVNGDDKPLKGRHLLVGQAFHTLFLEGVKAYDKLYHVADIDFKLNTKAGKEAHAELLKEHPGQLILKPQEHELIMAMDIAFLEHPLACAMREADRPVEQTVIGTLPTYEIQSKCRIDKVCKSFLLDIKTSGYLCQEQFIDAIIDYNYHAQAAYYCDVYEAVTGERKGFRFLCVSKGGDHNVWIVDVSNQLMAAGRKYYQSILTLYQRYKENGNESQ